MNTKSKAITIRIDAALYSRIMAQRSDNESQTALYTRILLEGINTLEGSGEHQSEPPNNTETELEALKLSVQVLSDQLERQSEQLRAAMDQNTRLTQALQNEQTLTLQGITQIKQLEEAKPKRRSFTQWLKGE